MKSAEPDVFFSHGRSDFAHLVARGGAKMIYVIEQLISSGQILALVRSRIGRGKGFFPKLRGANDLVAENA